MICRVVFTPKAECDLKRLPIYEGKRINDELTALAEALYPCIHIKKLKGQESIPIYSHRIGRFRIILTIEDDVMVIFVIGDPSKNFELTTAKESRRRELNPRPADYESLGLISAIGEKFGDILCFGYIEKFSEPRGE